MDNLLNDPCLMMAIGCCLILLCVVIYLQGRCGKLRSEIDDWKRDAETTNLSRSRAVDRLVEARADLSDQQIMYDRTIKDLIVRRDLLQEILFRVHPPARFMLNDPKRFDTWLATLRKGKKKRKPAPVATVRERLSSSALIIPDPDEEIQRKKRNMEHPYDGTQNVIR